MIEVNFIIIGIYEGRKDMKISDNILKIDDGFKIKKGDKILLKLYSSLRNLTK